MAKKDNNKIKNLDNTVDSILYDMNKSDIKRRNDIDELKNKIDSINVNFNNITKTPNVIEFLTQTILNDTSETKRRKLTNERSLSKKTKDSINELLNKNTISLLLTEEKQRIERYSDYRIIDAYIPQISRCMDLYRDCILSPDDITKSSINVIYDDKNVDENELKKINDNIEELKTKFKIDKKAKSWLRDGLVDGDTFVSILKIDDEINKMLIKENHELNGVLPIDRGTVLTENQIFTKEDDDLLLNIINESINNSTNKNSKSKNNINVANDLNAVKKDLVRMMNDNIIYINNAENDIDIYKNLDKVDKKDIIVMDGAILKTLEPEKVIKLNLDEVNLGYLYIEKYDLENDTDVSSFSMSASSFVSSSTFSSGSTTITTSTLDYFNSSNLGDKKIKNVKERLLADLFVKGISKKLDKKIIEANPQFKEIIYQLIKEDYLLNKKIKIVYYEPEQVVHYRNDSDDTYGISKLAKILFFAKLYLATLLTEIMQKISRGRDKRVVYVETGLDEDIDSSIQDVVRDMKTKDIQIDSLKSLSSVFREIGAFEDYYIPKIDGEVPIDLETISGMDVNIDDDFLQYLLKSIISGIGVPATYTDASNEVDFSRSLVMQNTTFVREIVSKQGDFEPFLSEIVQKIYEYEYPNSKDYDFKVDFSLIKVILPTPEFLNISNVNEQINNNSTIIEFIINTYFNMNDGMNEDLKQLFKREVTKDIVTTVDWDKYDEIFESCKLTINKEKIENEDDNDEEGFDDGGEGGFDGI